MDFTLRLTKRTHQFDSVTPERSRGLSGYLGVDINLILALPLIQCCSVEKTPVEVGDTGRIPRDAAVDTDPKTRPVTSCRFGNREKRTHLVPVVNILTTSSHPRKKRKQQHQKKKKNTIEISGTDPEKLRTLITEFFRGNKLHASNPKSLLLPTMDTT